MKFRSLDGEILVMLELLRKITYNLGAARNYLGGKKDTKNEIIIEENKTERVECIKLRTDVTIWSLSPPFQR